MDNNKKAYPEDLSNEEWQLIMPHLPVPRGKGRRCQQNWRELLNAMFYLARTGCQWRNLPHDFPCWQTVYYHFQALVRAGVWQSLNTVLSQLVRQRVDKEAQVRAAAMDSQSVKATETACFHGYDAGKKTKGLKRHILVDTLGLILAVVVHTAATQDRVGAVELLHKAKGLEQCSSLTKIWADGAYTGKTLETVAKEYGWTIEIIKRSDDVKGFVILPKRWVVERTFGWFNGFRRLAKGYERKAATAEAFIFVTMTRLLLTRLQHSFS